MAQEDVRLSGTFLDSAGNALADKTVTLFSEGTITPALATDTTDSSGEWDFTRTTPGRYDVQLVTGTQTYRILGRDKFQVTELQARNATSLTQPAGIFTNTYTNGGAAAAGLTAIHSFRPATESSGVESAVAGVNGSSVYNDFQLTNSATTPEDFIAGRLAFEAVDVANGSEDSKLNLWTMKAGTLTEVLHLDGTSLHPETTDGVSLGTSALNFSDLFLDSGAVVNFDSGNLTLTHSAGLLTVSGGLTVTGATTLNGNVTLGSDAADVITVNGTVSGASAVIFEGTASVSETSLDVVNPTADATIKLPAMSAGTYFLPVLDTVSTTAISSTPEELNILDGATVVVAEINYLDLGATAVGTAIASKAVVLDASKDYTGINNLTIAGELDAATLDLSSSADIAGDLVLSGGADGALQFTNAGENSIKIPDNQASALIIEEANNAYLIFDTANSSESVSIGTGVSGTAISIGHSTSTTTVNDDLVVTGDLTINGTTTTVDTTNTLVTDNLLELNSGATSNANDSGIIIERGSTGNNAILMWDESATGFTVGTTTATADSTGNLANFAAAPFTAAAITGTVLTGTTSGVFASDMTITSGSIVSASGAITFVDENLATTGTVATGALTVGGLGVITNGNGLVVGHTAKVVATGVTSEFQYVGTGADDTAFLHYLASTNKDMAPTYRFVKNANATVGTNSTSVVDDERVGEIRWLATDGTDADTIIAQYYVETDDASPEAGGIGAAHVWKNTPGGGTGGLTENMRLTAAGDLSIGLANKLMFDITGTGDTYIYQESADDLHIVVGDVAMMQFDQDIGAAVISAAGSAPLDQALLSLRGAFTSGGGGTDAEYLLLGGTLNSASGDTRNVGIINIDSQINTQDVDETTTAVASLIVNEPNIDKGTNHEITTAASIYVVDAPTEGDQNYALHIASGAVGVAGSAGTDGQVLTSGGANANAAWEDAAAGGLAHASQFRITTGFTGTATPITSNWEEVDTDGYDQLGTAVTESSGIFTFPATGIYYVTWECDVFSDGQGATTAVTGELQTSVNAGSGDDYDTAARWRTSLYASNAVNNGYCSFIFDVTSTTTHKVRASITANAATVNGQTAQNRNALTFIKLGET